MDIILDFEGSTMRYNRFIWERILLTIEMWGDRTGVENRIHVEKLSIARMRVPKMVKNGFNSGLPVSPVFEEDKIPQEVKNRHEAQSRPWIMKGE